MTPNPNKPFGATALTNENLTHKQLKRYSSTQEGHKTQRYLDRVREFALISQLKAETAKQFYGLPPELFVFKS